MKDTETYPGRPTFVTVSQSAARDARQAVEEAAAGIDPAQSCFVLALVPQGLDLDVLSEALTDRLDGVPVFGCTTAGQITTQGYETETLLLIAFRKENFRCASILFAPLKPLAIAPIISQVERQNAQFPRTPGWNRLALVFADGLSKQEDLLASVLESALDGIPVFGGSAGDGLVFGKTFILHNGSFRSNAALLLMVETDLQFQGLSFDHFLPNGTQLVITEANAEERLVHEINGAPAAQEYARLIGCAVEDLTPQVFAENPMLVCHNDKHYVRAVFALTEDQSLSFLAAIDDGLVMMLGKGKDVIEALEAELDVRDAAGRSPDFIIAFDCVLRKLEFEEKQLDGRVSEIFRRNRVLGFNTYGEQHCGLHMNQTFVGVAFFERDGSHAPWA
ncbi:FIST N-terminal domain-containing protein [Antarctobacter sp.]|uniref:FIST N-terminal domain-containing protein n=1 Tax=Antarctobacter sp. TaxID=1872577 RepID=UPI003A935333